MVSPCLIVCCGTSPVNYLFAGLAEPHVMNSPMPVTKVFINSKAKVTSNLKDLQSNEIPGRGKFVQELAAGNHSGVGKHRQLGGVTFHPVSA